MGVFGTGVAATSSYCLAPWGIALTNSIRFIADGKAYKGDNLTTWQTTSDERVKENIEVANLDICYNNVKNIPLKRFSFVEGFLDSNSYTDRTRLGWIAQEVRTVFPKAIGVEDKGEPFGNCLTLNVDQMYATMYGAIKKLIQFEERRLRGTGTIATGSFSNVISVSGVSGSSPTIHVTPIFNGEVRTLNVSTFDIESNSFTVYGGPGDFFWSVTS
jgi:hypothetical protein